MPFSTVMVFIPEGNLNRGALPAEWKLDRRIVPLVTIR